MTDISVLDCEGALLTSDAHKHGATSIPSFRVPRAEVGDQPADVRAFLALNKTRIFGVGVALNQMFFRELCMHWDRCRSVSGMNGNTGESTVRRMVCKALNVWR